LDVFGCIQNTWDELLYIYIDKESKREIFILFYINQKKKKEKE
jgi:hypothetical protein